MVTFRLPFAGLSKPNAATDQIEKGIGVNVAARICLPDSASRPSGSVFDVTSAVSSNTVCLRTFLAVDVGL